MSDNNEKEVLKAYEEYLAYFLILNSDIFPIFENLSS